MFAIGDRAYCLSAMGGHVSPRESHSVAGSEDNTWVRPLLGVWFQNETCGGSSGRPVKGTNHMRRLSVFAAVIGLLLVMAIPVSAAKPLGGDMELDFNLGFDIDGAPCDDITWAGTVELEGTEYGIAFIPTGGKDVGKAHHFIEDWVIYDTPFVFEDDFVAGVLVNCVPVDAKVVLAGIDAGVSSPNSKYRMNGTVGEANAPFAEWLGRNVHMSGIITWQEIQVPEDPEDPNSALITITVPATAPGHFRIN